MGGAQSGGADVGGFRVFKVNAGSPAAEAGLEVFFDFIVEINGTPMDPDQATFAQKIIEAANTRAKMTVFNIRTQVTRDVFINPRKWGGAGLLGAVVRYDSLSNVDNQGIRVLEVFENSPAEEAGLAPLKDFLLGTAEVMFRDLDELAEIVTLCQDKQIQLFVYNSDTEAIREVNITPRHGWGGEGVLGADIRTGMLHRIPAPRRPFHFASATGYPTPTQAQAQAAVPAAVAAVASRAPTAASAYLAALQGAAPAAEGEDAGEGGGCDGGAALPHPAAGAAAAAAAAAAPAVAVAAAGGAHSARGAAGRISAAAEIAAAKAAAAAAAAEADAGAADTGAAHAASGGGAAAACELGGQPSSHEHGEDAAVACQADGSAGAAAAAQAAALPARPPATAPLGGVPNGQVANQSHPNGRMLTELACELPDPGVIYEVFDAK